MSKILIYIHGLGSKGNTQKSNALQDALKKYGVEVIAPNFPLDPQLVVNQVKSILQKRFDQGNLDKVVFCGTSIGGFYSTYFGELYDAPYITVNPACVPSESFKRHMENPPLDFVTKQSLKIQSSMIETFKELEKITISSNLANVFLANDDVVIPPNLAKEKYKSAHSLIVTEKGGHRFDTEWQLVIDKAIELLK